MLASLVSLLVFQGARGKSSLTPERRRHKTSMAVVPVVTTVPMAPTRLIRKGLQQSEAGLAGLLRK